MPDDNNTNSSEADIKNLDFGSIIFLHINRIQALSTRECNREDKLFNFLWSVKMLRAIIPDDLIDKDFRSTEDSISEDRTILIKQEERDYQAEYENAIKLFSLCINQFSKKGYLYKRVQIGKVRHF